MSNFIDLFKSFLNGYFEVRNDLREKDVIEKRFGLKSSKIYTLDELGILHNGISRERVRQIEAKAIKNLSTLINGNELKKCNYICDSLLTTEYIKLSKFIVDQEVILMDELITFSNSGINDIRHLNLVTKIMGINSTLSPNHDCNILISSNLDKGVFKKELKKVFEFLRQHIVYISKDELLIEMKKKRRNFDHNYILLALNSLKLEKMIVHDDELLAISIDDSFSAGDIGYRILFKNRHPMEISDIYMEFNKIIQSKNLSTSKSIRNLTNQMATHNKIVNIGAKQWALKDWNHDKKFIKDIIKEAFHNSGKHLSKEEIISFVNKTIPHIKSQTIISYLSYDDFLKIDGDFYILKEWKSKYTDKIIKTRRRRNFDELLLATFTYYDKENLTTDEIWNYIKVNFDSPKYYLKSYLEKRKYLYHEIKEDIDCWTRKSNYKEILKSKRGNKIKSINELATQYLYENNGSMALYDLVHFLVKEHGYNEKTCYQALSNNQTVEKFSNNNIMMISVLDKKNLNVSLIKVSELEFEEFLMKSQAEESCYDFKQGFLNLSEKREFDKKSFEKIMKNICAMANHGTGITGRLFIGICDSENDTLRVEKLDNIEIVRKNGNGIAGLQREAVILGIDLEKYQNYVLNKINDSMIPQKLKTHIKSNLGFIHYKNRYIMMIEVKCIDGPSLYNDTELYIRKGPNLEYIENNNPELQHVYRRCFQPNYSNQM
ncbi:RNA-binding domain-containing protein [Petrocella sp. FN5]|uniref:RNA-binding domain-containing protein n=1 Tax=Petrocella sp. FN5 TaxID=3032002 RepID=UPI0023D9D258|nr:RNA-binding domain-containing protein [Petrocella sp. FN5]MDF1616191.1 putative DNA binding domain-containing protein [Petrocella sp. FN5]